MTELVVAVDGYAVRGAYHRSSTLGNLKKEEWRQKRTMVLRWVEGATACDRSACKVYWGLRMNVWCTYQI